MKFIRLVAVLSAAAVLTACTSAPVADVTPPPLASTYANADLSAGGPAADTVAWWHGFHDPILDRLVDMALANNLDLKVAVARIDAARAVRIGAASQWLPSLDLNASAGRQRQSASQAFPTDTPTIGNAFDLNASLAWDIDIFGRIRQGVSAADADIASAQNDAAAVRIATIDETVRTYVTVRGLEQRLALVEANALSQRSTEESTRRLFDAGVVPIADVDRAAAQTETTLAELPSLQLQRQAAIHRLSIISASTVQDTYAQLDPPAPWPTWSAPAPGIGTPADLLRRRPDVRAAEARVVAAYARIGVAEADLKPHLQLIGVIGAAIDGFSGATLARSLAWMAGAGASAPLFDGGRRRSVVALRRAEADQAVAAYRTAVLTAVSDVETSVAATARNHGRTERLERAVANARGAYTQINRSWRSGESAFIDTLEVQRSLLTAEDALAQARTDEMLSKVRLMSALGQ
ncbi:MULTISPECIES: efflux transporter outer membrane subunit [Burkholderia]|uniref:NodT family efflux transporter outer membrane factor (OMF) lipoprotein n=1 Tax=Burkholderia pyrrocinia TaxID=60550 RepID=A0A318IL25_BURPY|nr:MULTISPECIES: efflux transporter outer membrane subunit [Burkholderia]PXX33856.1 NodT family efflux transporter outer membrane factor (OMF) lipoprotein [Burkholderia pyrrocinia]SFW64665.1 efflux transporter, outer membrane factor (OMF) lipoprotein, NodT family [Burkholderia sp. NFACC33-1]SFY22243.1 efflux transporter, outer membrane factor (OMF) lipoprotein, NodT family [Burkholderia sp. NFPP32]